MRRFDSEDFRLESVDLRLESMDIRLMFELAEQAKVPPREAAGELKF